MVAFAHWNRCAQVLLCWGFWVVAAQGGYVETLDHQKYEGAVRVLQNGVLSISVGAQQQQIPLDQVRFARLNPPLFEPGAFPKGWRVEEIGDVQGNAVETNNLYTLRVTGGKAKDAKVQIAQFVYRVLRGDGEVVARVQSVDAKSPCLAGVILRDTLDPYSALGFLGVTPDHHLRFDSREGGWLPIEKRDEGSVKLPIWLKIVREQKEKEKEPFVSAYRSEDGKRWQKVGQTKLPWRSEPVPEGSDNWQPRFYAGVAITGPGTNTISTARMDRVAVTAHGLLGEYFADDSFRNRRFARADSKLDFDWAYGSPGPGIEEDHFSVRWIGKVEPKFSENYRFYFDADNDAELWVNGEKLPQVAFKKDKLKEYKGRELPLQAGEKYDIKLEFKEGAGAASVRVGWSSASQPPQIVSRHYLSYEYNANSPEEEDPTTFTNAVFAKGIWLRNGSYIAGEIVSCDDSMTRVSWPGQVTPLIVPNTKIAHIVFRLSRRGLPLQLSENHTGMILKNGDFLEAEFIGLKGRSLIVNSLLFGRRAFSLDNNDAVALVLNNYSPVRAAYEIKLKNGSALRAKSLRADGETVFANDAAVGELPVCANDVLEIVNTAADRESSRLSNSR